MHPDTPETEPPPPLQFQFRLRSIFILMMITAFSLGVVPIWYQQVIVPEYLPSFTDHVNPDSPLEFREMKERRIQDANRYTPAFCFIAFVSSSGLWYAFASPTQRRSDLWLGLAFGHTLGFIVIPVLWAMPYLMVMELTMVPFGQSLQFADFNYETPYVLGLALIYSCWPLLLKRYIAAMLLLCYSCAYGMLMIEYGLDVIADAVD